MKKFVLIFLFILWLFALWLSDFQNQFIIFTLPLIYFFAFASLFVDPTKNKIRTRQPYMAKFRKSPLGKKLLLREFWIPKDIDRFKVIQIFVIVFLLNFFLANYFFKLYEIENPNSIYSIFAVTPLFLGASLFMNSLIIFVGAYKIIGTSTVLLLILPFAYPFSFERITSILIVIFLLFLNLFFRDCLSKVFTQKASSL